MGINWKPTTWINKLVDDRMMIAGKAMVNVAKSLVPVDTGLLKSKIYFTYQPSSKTLTLHADTGYAYYIETGTYKMRPRPYLRPAINAVAPSFLTGKIMGVNTQVMAGTYSEVDHAPKMIRPLIRPRIAAANRMHNVGATRRTEFTAVHMNRQNEARRHRVGLKQEPKVILSSLTRRRINTRDDAWN